MSYRKIVSAYTIFSLLILLNLFLSSCNDNFLTRYPEDQISNSQFWNGPDDAKLYINEFYAQLPSYPSYGGGLFWDDNNSDNLIPVNYNTRTAGFNTINSGNNYWSDWYSEVREVNFMFANYKNPTENTGKIYLAEAKFFRAYFYFQLVKLYGAVPWINKPLNTDSEELYKARTPRNIVIDSVLTDLDIAIENLPLKSEAETGRLNKEAALVFKSRVALYEGTWEKYHQGTSFGVKGSFGQKYLESAAEAAKELIDLGTSQIYSTGHPYSDYYNLFNQTDLSDNSEILLWKKYDISQGLSHNLQAYLPVRGGGNGLSKALVEAYLTDKAQPIAVSSRYQGDQYLQQVIKNRDPRLEQTVWIPGDTTKISGNGSVSIFDKPQLDGTGEERNTTGYQLRKGASTDPAGQDGAYGSTTAYIIFRYAEALLNYAEAKAELDDLGAGIITQADLDISVNKIRSRVDMPALIKGAITTDPNWDYPNLDPLLNEIRRERRVELACEGYRLNDILRWAAADKLLTGVQPLGAQFQPDKFPNMTIGQDIYVNSEGYIEPYKVALNDGWSFKSERDYLLPIPPQEITLNNKLTQNPNW